MQSKIMTASKKVQDHSFEIKAGPALSLCLK